MHRRLTTAERHTYKVKNFEYNHPRNKYVKRRQAKRARLEATAHSAFVECLHRMAARGNETARLMLSVSRFYSYFGM